MTLAHALYNAYNAGGDPATANKNYRGEPCPEWDDLPENIRAKWEACVSLINQEFGALPSTGASFGSAIAYLKMGFRVRRAGWNGKGMWLALSCDSGRETKAENFWSEHNKAYAEQNGGTATVLPCITMKTATGEILMGWLASQTDILAVDWEVVA